MNDCFGLIGCENYTVPYCLYVYLNMFCPKCGWVAKEHVRRKI